MYNSDHIITSKHYLVLFVSAFATGIFFATRFGIIFSLVFAAFAIIISACSYVLLKIKGLLKIKSLILTAVIIAASVLGIFRIYTAEYLYPTPLSEYKGREVWIMGTITSKPQLSSSGYYYAFELDVFGINNKTDYSGTIMMYVPKSCGCDFDAGANVYAWTKIEMPDDAGNISSSDYYTYLRGKNIFLTGTAKNINPLTDIPLTNPIVALKKAGSFVRSGIVNSIDGLFADDSISAAVLKGILIGDKSGFDDELYNKFSYAGISHIVAVSGLHISILFSFLIIFTNMFSTNRRLNFLVAVPVIILFMSASAFTPSVCRASIMILIMILSAFTREEYNPATALFLALGLILAAAPYALFSKSLILSFTATLGIFVYAPYINKLFIYLINSPKLKLKKHKLAKKSLVYLITTLSLSISSMIGTAYFLILFFGGISKVQFLTNLWVIPLVSVIFCLGYVCCILYYICPFLAASVLKYPLSWCLEAIKFTIDKFGTPDNILSIASESLNGVAMIIYFGFALLLYITFKVLIDIKMEKEI